MTTQKEIRASIFTEEQKQELIRLKSYFPFRIIWGRVCENGKFEAFATVTRHELNKSARNPKYLVCTI